MYIRLLKDALKKNSKNENTNCKYKNLRTKRKRQYIRNTFPFMEKVSFLKKNAKICQEIGTSLKNN